MIRQSNIETAGTNHQATPWGDHFRALLHRLAGTAGGCAHRTARTVGVTSCTKGEGVSTVAMNLGLHAAVDQREHTLVIDLSETQSSAISVLGNRADVGFSDLLFRGAEPSECIHKAPIDGFAVLGMGSLAAQLHTTVDRHQLSELLAELKAAYQFIVVDLPTASRFNGCHNLAALLDGVLLVVEAERVRSHVAQHIRDELQQAGVNILGVVFNKRLQHVPGWLYRHL